MKLRRIRSLPFLLCLCAVAGCSGGGGSSCTTSDECGAGQYCNFTDFSCGAAGGKGDCEPVGTACTLDSAPVCSCDRLTFVNECWAAADSQSLRAPGECP
ncbi:MAG: hypothetical protein IT290_05675 [Deltaproteobacteria bacterium]|nr:hypothetical protein [Deltaproteobacteria bacterium]